jgi:hypothetical protein
MSIKAEGGADLRYKVYEEGRPTAPTCLTARELSPLILYRASAS